jgi:hypothetical protein
MISVGGEIIAPCFTHSRSIRSACSISVYPWSSDNQTSPNEPIKLDPMTTFQCSRASRLIASRQHFAPTLRDMVLRLKQRISGGRESELDRGHSLDSLVEKPVQDGPPIDLPGAPIHTAFSGIAEVPLNFTCNTHPRRGNRFTRFPRAVILDGDDGLTRAGQIFWRQICAVLFNVDKTGCCNYTDRRKFKVLVPIDVPGASVPVPGDRHS